MSFPAGIKILGKASSYQIKVPMAFAGRDTTTTLLLNLSVKDLTDEYWLYTISTFFESGVLNATLGRYSGTFELTLTDPGLTNFAE